MSRCPDCNAQLPDETTLLQHKKAAADVLGRYELAQRELDAAAVALAKAQESAGNNRKHPAVTAAAAALAAAQSRHDGWKQVADVAAPCVAKGSAKRTASRATQLAAGRGGARGALLERPENVRSGAEKPADSGGNVGDSLDEA